MIEPAVAELLQQLADRCYGGPFVPLGREVVEALVAAKIEN